MKDFISNNWQWVIGFIVGVLAIIIAYLQYIKSNNKRKIKINVNSPISRENSSQTINYFQTVNKIQEDHETQRLKEIRRTFYFEIKSVIKPLEVQIKELNRYCESYNDTSLTQRIFNVVTNINITISNIEKLDIIDLNRIFPNSEKEIFNIVGDVKLIEKIIKNIEIENELSEYKRMKYGIIIKESMYFFDDILLNYNSILNADYFYDSTDTYLYTFKLIIQNHLSNAHNHDLYFGRDTLIIPLYNLICNFPIDERGKEIAGTVNKCLYAYKSIQNNISELTKMIDTNIEQLSKIKDNLVISIEHFA